MLRHKLQANVLEFIKAEIRRLLQQWAYIFWRQRVAERGGAQILEVVKIIELTQGIERKGLFETDLNRIGVEELEKK